MTSAPEDRIAKAQAYLAETKVYEAIGEFEALLKEDPNNFQGHMLLGFLQFKLGAITRGRECMNRALSCAPTADDKNKIRSILREQDNLDKRRHYRPDFEALNKPKEN